MIVPGEKKRRVPCSTCPWRKSNFGAPNPPRSIIGDIQDWYSAANARRLWKEIRAGDMMSCHCTEALCWRGAPEEPVICLGSLLLVVIHCNSVVKLGSFRAYRQVAGKLGMTRAGMARYLERSIFGQLPTVTANPTEFGFPWEDPIVQLFEDTR